MSLNRRRDRDFERKRSNSLPTPSNVFKNKEVVKFFSRRNSSDSESCPCLESINFFMDSNPELEVSDCEEIFPKYVQRYICIQRQDIRQNCQHHKSRNLKRGNNVFVMISATSQEE
ncbi:hypothetical protein CEXT_298551 [Caerostris extrusa]|uniref:Uncharacterized protein n=1 Tax=Caerostris extrusa TaxID=172846 RepID=A0AAV4WLE5_CAEEX|nr:hypothetical protein CEXT_298551 [Caerostris extrusa]